MIKTRFHWRVAAATGQQSPPKGLLILEGNYASDAVADGAASPRCATSQPMMTHFLSNTGPLHRTGHFPSMFSARYCQRRHRATLFHAFLFFYAGNIEVPHVDAQSSPVFAVYRTGPVVTPLISDVADGQQTFYVPQLVF